MRVLVTGSEGFIAGHLVRELEHQGHSVIESDRRHADLSLPWRIESELVAWHPDYVVHLGARYGRLLCRDEPHQAVCDNAAGTTELAATCAALGIPVLYTSSSEVYGDHGEDEITEESELRTPTTIYGLSKRWGEEALRLYLPPEHLTIVRLNMLYGPEQRGGYGCCALATFIRGALEGNALTVHQGASRSWLYISDAVKALALLIGKPGIWNLANTKERVTMVETANLVCEEVGSEPLIDYIEPPLGQIRHKQVSCSKLESLGWEPAIALHEGIVRTVQAARINAIRDYEEVPCSPLLN